MSVRGSCADFNHWVTSPAHTWHLYVSVTDRTPVLVFMQQALYPQSHLLGLKIIKTFKKVKAEHEPKHLAPPERRTLSAALSHPTGPALPEALPWALHDLLTRVLSQPAVSILQTHYVSPPCRVCCSTDLCLPCLYQSGLLAGFFRTKPHPSSFDF